MKNVLFTTAARRQLRKFNPAVRAQISDKLGRYAETGAGDVTALKGREGARLRVGDYRVIFTESDAAIVVVAVGHRREVYD